MGKHDAPRHARGGEKKKTPKALLWVILGVALIGVIFAAVSLVAGGAFAPAEVAADRTPEATEEPAVPAADEEQAIPETPEYSGEEEARRPGEEPSNGEAAPVSGAEAPEEPADEAEEIRITGDVDPADEVVNHSGETTPAEDILAGGEAAQGAEPVLRLEPEDGQSRRLYRQDNPGGMAVAEFLVEGDIITASAESTYASVAGLDDATVESLAMGFTMTEIPAEYADSAELFWERQGDWLIMVTVLRGLDDPAKLEAYGDYGLMRIVNDDSYTLSQAEEFLFELGYVKQ